MKEGRKELSDDVLYSKKSERKKEEKMFPLSIKL